MLPQENNRKLKLWELDRVSEEAYIAQEKSPIVVVLDDIRSLNNIGSFFRTADAFMVGKIYLCGITACPPHKDIHKTALGATETVEWEYVESVTALAKRLKDNGFKIYSIEQAENTIKLDRFSFNIDQKIALFFGNEVNGVAQDVVNLSDVVLEIPQFGTKHSLNVSVCAGIILWEFVKRFHIG
ncbi:MAG: RNA methyltransferase [Bacteroidetes bacterium]|nr:RNA methyltransferase [Bacteroidota bacterium]